MLEDRAVSDIVTLAEYSDINVNIKTFLDYWSGAWNERYTMLLNEKEEQNIDASDKLDLFKI